MSIDRKDVLHVAKLAELAVADNELAPLTEQLGRIVEFVEQLNEVPASEQAPPFLAGPPSLTLRPDVVDPVPLARGPAEIAPEFSHGLFEVPRLGAMEDS
ncbi:MAG: Asp-tRNA(Asn)/Glu-tRNA(Gln) amidotransferase subunit GatC [bacterium]